MNNILKVFIGLLILLIIGLGIGIPVSIMVQKNETNSHKAIRILENNPLIDGHNNLAWLIRNNFGNNLEMVDLEEITNEKYNLSKSNNITHTDVKRMRKGKLSGQFWTVYGTCQSAGKDAVRVHLEQIDIIKRFIRKYSSTFQFVTSHAELELSITNKKIASLLGMETALAIDSSMGVLRLFYELGIRYMTLTHNCDTPWATNWLVDDKPNPEKYGGLNEFGKLVVKEMNRLGMVVDLSHASTKTMEDVLVTSKAPVIFSHSNVYELCNHSRNIKDHVLKMLKANNGVIMITFFNDLLGCSQNSTVNDVVHHIDYVKNFIGADHVAIGADFDGMPRTPQGAEDVSKYPNVFEALLDIGWTEGDLIKLAGANIMRVLKSAEQV